VKSVAGQMNLLYILFHLFIVPSRSMRVA